MQGENNQKQTEIQHFKQSIENFRMEIKDLQHEGIVKEQNMKNGFETEKSRYARVIKLKKKQNYNKNRRHQS